jgi:hypothetical protein
MENQNEKKTLFSVRKAKEDTKRSKKYVKNSSPVQECYDKTKRKY